MQDRATSDFWQSYHALWQEVRARATKEFRCWKQIRSVLHYNSTERESATDRKWERADRYLWFSIGDRKSYGAPIS
jgi:hypothetical protein